MVERKHRNISTADIEGLPVVTSDLLRKEHVEYCLGIYNEIGDREKVIYYKMGPDISTPLLTTNATEIIGIDSTVDIQEHSSDYVDKYWEIVDQRPTLSPYSIGVLSGDLSVKNYLLPKSKVDMFNDDLDDRKSRGYWNHRFQLNFGNDRALIIELKRLGVNSRSIKINTRPDLITDVNFNWAFPGEKSKPRHVVYVPQHLVGETRRNIINILKSSDCYYQKGQRVGDTLAMVQDVQPFLKENSIVAIGYQFPFNKNNSEYNNELSIALGHWYRIVDISPSPIDNIIITNDNRDPRELKEDMDYGMKMHVFERRQYPIKKYHYNFGGADYF